MATTGHVGFACGSFDVFNRDHLAYLNEASRRCDLLIVGVVGDDLHERIHGVLPVVPFLQRFEIIQAMAVVDHAIPVLGDDLVAIRSTTAFDLILTSPLEPMTPFEAALATLAESGVPRVEAHPAATGEVRDK